MKRFLRELLTDLFWKLCLMSIIIIMALVFIQEVVRPAEYRVNRGTVIVTEHGQFYEPDPLPGGKMIAFY